MFPRLLKLPRTSFFLFGPRGTGKTTWLRHELGDAQWFDLLSDEVHLDLLAAPGRLDQRLPPNYRGWVVIDEVQKNPALLDEVHRLIEARGTKFALTGSSARKLRSRGVNLLAGRALTLAMHPLTRRELGDQYSLSRSLRIGQLPMAQTAPDAGSALAYLRSYVGSYLRQEVQQEGLTRNLAGFARFLEAASFSQASVLNVSAVSRECHVDRKVVEDYFAILEDLMLAARLPVFTRSARRATVSHPKFYFFDVGVFRALRPRGPLDRDEEIEGAALETLVLQEIRTQLDRSGRDASLSYWRTRDNREVDFVIYGAGGLHAIEVKHSARVRPADTRALQAFVAEYPAARARLVYTGHRRYREGKVEILPIEECLEEMEDLG